MTTVAGTTRLLIVENDTITSESLRALLRDRGYDAEQAGTAERALEMATIHPPDAMIVDLYLPSMSGVTMLRAARACEALRGVPVLLITAAADEAVRETVAELRGLQPAALLRKPFDIHDLIARLESLLGGTQT